MKTTYTYSFNFTSEDEEKNKETLEKIIDELGLGCVEKVEKLFDITFASGFMDGRPIFLNLDGEDINNDYLMGKFDGKVLLTTPPLDHETKKPFTKTKLTFKVEVIQIDNGFNRVKSYINSKFRNALIF
jgi:hypothetical protein